MQKTAISNTDIARLVGADALYVDGEKVDGRTLIARRWRDQIAELAVQRGSDPSPSEGMLIRRSATLAVLCERDEARLIAGEEINEENYRRNVAALKAALIGLGLAKKSRDVTKADGQTLDAHAAAVLDAD